jgi:predicted amidohydrolase YtcJ
MKLDTILENATVVTLDGERPTGTRVGIWQGRIVGVDEQIDGMDATDVVDLGGATVLPGFIDAHTHLQLTGQGMLAVNVSAARTPEAALAIIAEAAQDRPADAWVEVSGYDQREIGRDLTASELQVAAGGRKVWARHISSHSSVVSTTVLDAIPDQSRRNDPEIGAGLFKELDQALVHSQRLPYSLDDAGRTITIAAEAARREGVTFCMEAGAGGRLGSLNNLDISTYLRLMENGPLPVRMQLMPSRDVLHPVKGGAHDGFVRGLDVGLRTGFGSDMLQLGAMKITLDGGMMVRTARLTEPYADGTELGEYSDDPAAMIADIVDAHVAGWQLAVHAIGDAAIDVAIEAFTACAAAAPMTRRHRIEHGGYIRNDQIAPLAALDIAIVSQPSFLYDSGDDFAAQLGAERVHGLYRGKSLLDAGIRIVGSTDRPLSGTPLRIIQSLVDRTSSRGTVVGDGEQIGVADALATITTHGSWIAGMEDRLGKVRSGFLADLTILGANPLDTATDAIAAIPVHATVVDGRLVEVTP